MNTTTITMEHDTVHRLMLALQELEHARITAAHCLWNAITLRDECGNGGDPVWIALDGRLSEQGMPTTAVPPGEFLAGCCWIR